MSEPKGQFVDREAATISGPNQQLLSLFLDLSDAIAQLKTACPPEAMRHLEATAKYTGECFHWANRHLRRYAPAPLEGVSQKNEYLFVEHVPIGADLTAQRSEAVRLVCNSIALACHVVVTMLARPAGDPQTEAPPPPPIPLGGPAFTGRRGFHLVMEESNIGSGVAGTIFDWSAIPKVAAPGYEFAYAARPAGEGTTEGPGPVEESADRPAGDPTAEAPGPSLKKQYEDD